MMTGVILPAGSGRTPSAGVPKCGLRKLNAVIRLPMVGLFSGTRTPGAGFGRLSSL